MLANGRAGLTNLGLSILVFCDLSAKLEVKEEPAIERQRASPDLLREGRGSLRPQGG